MAKKNTYADMMKQLSNKKAKYQEGLDESNRMGNRGGIADYERRIAAVEAGMDELFGAQESSKAPQMEMGGRTSMYAGGGMTKKEAMYKLGGTYMQGPEQVNAGVTPWLPKAENGMDTGGGFTKESWMQYVQLRNAAQGGRITPDGQRMLAVLQAKVDSALDAGLKESDLYEGWDGVPTPEVQAQREATAKLEATRAASDAERAARVAAGVNTESAGPNPYAKAIEKNSKRVVEMDWDGTPGVYHKNGKMYRIASRGGAYLATEPMLKDIQDHGYNDFLGRLNSGVFSGGGVGQSETNPNLKVPFLNKAAREAAVNESPALAQQYAPTGEDRALLSGAQAVPQDQNARMLGMLNDTQPVVTPTSAPTTAGPTAATTSSAPTTAVSTATGTTATAPEVEVIPTLAGSSASPVLNTAKGDMYYPLGAPLGLQGDVTTRAAVDPTLPTKSHGLSDLTNRGANTFGRGLEAIKGMGGNAGNPINQNLGILAGGVSQLVPQAMQMKRMADVQGPVDLPTMRAMTMNSNVDTSQAINDIRQAEARSTAAIDANVSNPVVAAAMKRAAQRATQEQVGNISFQAAQQENQLRNQNLNQLRRVSDTNQGVFAQNEQRRVDFENERLAAMNNARMGMGDTLGVMFNDFQRQALDRNKLKYMREAYDPYNLGITNEERNNNSNG
jgi:hypothetical protein